MRITKDADTHITDPAVRVEARLFVQQEAVHSKAHHRHVKALVARHPGLQAAVDSVVAQYDELYERRDLRYHLAYAAALEGTFTPVFGALIDHRASLFADSDARVASLCLWHFCEEIEHRSSAVTVYNHVVGDHPYRLRFALRPSSRAIRSRPSRRGIASGWRPAASRRSTPASTTTSSRSLRGRTPGSRTTSAVTT